MKKKILSIIFTICLILPCAFIFSACDNNPTEPIMHTVTFVYDNGTENNTIEVEEGKFLTKPTNPSKTGFTFDGWFIDDFKWDFELVAVMKDTILTAKWTEIPTPITHTVKFMVDGEQFGETQTIESGNRATCPETNPNKTGYDFAGWFLGDEKWSFTLIPVTENIELVAHWIEIPTPATYTVTFVYDNGTENNTIEVEEGKFLTKPTNPNKTGFIFEGWFIDDFKWDFELVAVMKDTTLTAKWTEIPATTYFAVTFNADNGTDNETIQIVSGNKVTCPETNPTKYGYTFDGWYFGQYEWNFGYNTVTEALTLKAHWIANEYSITYELDGGINNPDNLPLYTVETNLTFAEPTKDGYKFMGWFVDSEFTTEITSTNDYQQNLTIYAKWLKLYTITYDLTGGINHPDNPSTFTEDEEVVLKAPTNDNPYYTFAGWVIDYATDEEISIIPVGTTKNMALRATWDLVYKIENNGNKTILGLTDIGKTLTKITIPKDVQEIGDGAFESSYNLQEVVFYEDGGTTSIGNLSFKDCIYLTSITLPSGLKSIKNEAFAGCSALEAITIPSSVWKICSFSFSGCTNLETVIFEENSELEEIMDNVFKSCAKLKNITLPSSLKTIKSNAFEGCSALEAISIPQNVESIWDYAFADCSSLKSVTFAENCKLAGISRSTFAGCSALETITIPSGVQNIGENAFNGCSKLASVDFEAESQLKCIYEAAFYSCYSLEAITIPKSVTEIKSEVFKGCKGLKTITFESNSGLTCIGSNAFNGCTNLTTIIIPKSVQQIKERVFLGCDELENITFETGSALTYIGSKTFSGCTSLTTITIPSSVEMIGNYLFDEFNHNIESIVFEDTSTWYVTTSESDWTSKTNGTVIDVSNSEANVEIFISYNIYYLYKINS